MGYNEGMAMKLKVGDLVRSVSDVDIGLGLIISYDPYEYYEPYTCLLYTSDAADE